MFIHSCARFLINKESPIIGSVYGECLENHAWDSLFSRFSTKKIKDTIIYDAFLEFDNQVFKCDVLYFEEEPLELIGIDSDMIRYVYNPNVSSEILSGFNLEEKEKNRIANRVQSLLIEFQCEEGRKQSLKKIKERKE